MKHIPEYIAMAMLSFMMFACTSTRDNYGIEFQSKLPYEISETRAYVDGQYFAGAGYLGVGGGGKSEHGIREPVPDFITLKWKEPDGSMNEVLVDLKNTISSPLKDHTIILTITEKGEVEISVEKYFKVWD